MKNIVITQACSDDIDEIIQLKKEIWNKMENKDWYMIDGTNKEFLENLLKNDGLILKAISNDKIVGFLIVERNKKKESSIIRHTNLENEVNRCIELSNTAVDYEYRGNNLYTLMAQMAEEFMIKKYNIKYILATVHPDNIASMKSLLKIGYSVHCKTKMYSGKDRCILIKKVK